MRASLYLSYIEAQIFQIGHRQFALWRRAVVSRYFDAHGVIRHPNAMHQSVPPMPDVQQIRLDPSGILKQSGPPHRDLRS